MKRPVPLLAAGLFLLAAATLHPVLSAGFLHWDDDQYVTENPQVNRGLSRESAAWAFRTDQAGNWHPLTWLSHMLDVTFFGLDPRGHHRTSLILHAANTVLLLLALRAYTGALWRSAGAAALFAVHPLHVESVAWISERKDLLAALFFLLTLLAYRRYVRAPGRRRFLPVPLLFALGLMAKPMLVTLPFVLLLLDEWPLSRIGAAAGRGGGRRALLEKASLVLMALVSSVVTIMAQRGAMAGIEGYPVGHRMANAVVSYVRYLGKTLSGADLSCLDIMPAKPWPPQQVAAAAALLCAIGILALRQARRRPYLAVGWLWFLGMLLPVIGLVQVGRQAMADRYTYLPLIGLFIAAAWGAGDLVATRRRSRIVAVSAAAVLVLILLAARARDQAALWRDDLTLFGHAVRVDPANWQMQNSLGTALAGSGRPDEAIRHFRLALATPYLYEKPWYNLGHTLETQGKFADAVPYLTRALSLKPDYPAAHASLGTVLLELGRDREAADHLKEAWRLAPGSLLVAINLGLAHERLGDREGAERWYREALRLDPDNAQASLALGSRRDENRQSPGFRDAGP